MILLQAQAIMLLAGTDSTCSSNHMNLPGASVRPFPTRMSQPSSRVGSPAPQMTTSSAGTAALPGAPRAVNRQALTAATTGLIGMLLVFLSVTNFVAFFGVKFY